MKGQKIVNSQRSKPEPRTMAEANTVGKRIRFYRQSKALGQQDLSDLTGVAVAQLSRYENDHGISGPTLKAIAHALGVHVEDLTIGPETRAPRRPSFTGNPKPVQIGEVCVDTVYRMFGNHVHPIDIDVKYNPARLNIHPKLRNIYHKLAEKAIKDAKAGEYDYFPHGPCARLDKIVPRTTQLASGPEQTGATLNLGPVSWEEYTVLNDLLPAEVETSFFEELMTSDSLYREPLDLSWCWLSRILTVLLIPITKDGFGVAQWRAPGAVACASGLLTAGVNENMHRYLDEAPPNDLSRRLHSIDKKSTSDDLLWHATQAEGVPSPILTAQRGLYEELSIELHRITMEKPRCYKFLNVIFDFHFFHPNLVGVIELGLDKDDVDSIIKEHPGATHQEHVQVEYVNLKKNDERALALISDHKSWCCWGLSAMISAMHYWQHDRS